LKQGAEERFLTSERESKRRMEKITVHEKLHNMYNSSNIIGMNK
jgi:hypothetical protein